MSLLFKSLLFKYKDYWTQMHDNLIDEHRLRQFKFVHLFIYYYVKFAWDYDEARDHLIISAARLY